MAYQQEIRPNRTENAKERQNLPLRLMILAILNEMTIDKASCHHRSLLASRKVLALANSNWSRLLESMMAYRPEPVTKRFKDEASVFGKHDPK